MKDLKYYDTGNPIQVGDFVVLFTKEYLDVAEGAVMFREHMQLGFPYLVNEAGDNVNTIRVRNHNYYVPGSAFINLGKPSNKMFQNFIRDYILDKVDFDIEKPFEYSFGKKKYKFDKFDFFKHPFTFDEGSGTFYLRIPIDKTLNIFIGFNKYDIYLNNTYTQSKNLKFMEGQTNIEYNTEKGVIIMSQEKNGKKETIEISFSEFLNISQTIEEYENKN